MFLILFVLSTDLQTTLTEIVNISGMTTCMWSFRSVDVFCVSFELNSVEMNKGFREQHCFKGKYRTVPNLSDQFLSLFIETDTAVDVW